MSLQFLMRLGLTQVIKDAESGAHITCHLFLKDCSELGTQKKMMFAAKRKDRNRTHQPQPDQQEKDLIQNSIPVATPS